MNVNTELFESVEAFRSFAEPRGRRVLLFISVRISCKSVISCRRRIYIGCSLSRPTLDWEIRRKEFHAAASFTELTMRCHHGIIIMSYCNILSTSIGGR
jgi:hypothetical protein